MISLPPVRTPCSKTILFQLTICYDHLSISTILWSNYIWWRTMNWWIWTWRQEVVVGDLMKKFAVFLLGAGAHLMQTHILTKRMNELWWQDNIVELRSCFHLFTVLHIMWHPSNQTFTQISLSKTEAEVRHLLLNKDSVSIIKSSQYLTCSLLRLNISQTASTSRSRKSCWSLSMPEVGLLLSWAAVGMMPSWNSWV